MFNDKLYICDKDTFVKTINMQIKIVVLYKNMNYVFKNVTICKNMYI